MLIDNFYFNWPVTPPPDSFDDDDNDLDPPSLTEIHVIQGYENTKFTSSKFHSNNIFVDYQGE